MKRFLIIGGGAAGMLSSVYAARNGMEVHLFEQNEKLGKKLFITGKGRCNFTNGCAADETAGQINYILIDPEAQVSRVKYSYINVFTPGHDSRTADNYIYQNRRFNGTFALDALLKAGCAINYTAHE